MTKTETETKEPTEAEQELKDELIQLELRMDDQTALIDELVWTLYQLIHQIDYETKRGTLPTFNGNLAIELEAARDLLACDKVQEAAWRMDFSRGEVLNLFPKPAA